ncbi:MAG TPA: hypothetical protein VFF67_09460 [Thermoplasmata archaeon]|nr:hypothetical protein [Thermoplasmata archaeon]
MLEGKTVRTPPAIEPPAATPPPSPELGRPAAPYAHAAWVAFMLLLVGAAVALFEWAYAGNPYPPGGDSGRWVAMSYPYAGLKYPAPGPFAYPFSYPPLSLLLLAGFARLTGNAATTGFAAAGTLVALYGLSLIVVARRFLDSGPLQVAFVGLALFNDAMLVLLFWGDYPNMLGFAALNVAMVALLLFLKRGTTASGLAFYGALGLVFLTHDLTFAIAAAAAGVAGLVFLVHRRIGFGFLVRYGNLLGLALLEAVIAAWEATSFVAGVPHPGYVYGNPAAYAVKGVGHTLDGLPTGCDNCAWDNLAPSVALALLFGLSIAMQIVLFMLRRFTLRTPVGWPAASGSVAVRTASVPLVDGRTLVAAAWLTGALLAPAIGWLAHVDTVYFRFGYFLPVPGALLACLLIERVAYPWLVPFDRPPLQPPVVRSLRARVATAATLLDRRRLRRPAAVAPGPAIVGGAFAHLEPESRGRTPHLPSLAARRGATVVAGSIAVVLAVALAGLTAPALARNRDSFHNGLDAEFTAAMEYLNRAPPGPVLSTDTNAAHWGEATTARDFYVPSYVPYLNFYPMLIGWGQQTYWAVSCRWATTDGLGVTAFSGANDSTFPAMPLYAVYVDGVAAPVLDVDPTSFVVEYAGSGRVNSTEPTWGGASVAVTAGSPETISATFVTPTFRLVDQASVVGAGTARIGLSLTPAPGVVIARLHFAIGAAPAGETALHATDVRSVTGAGTNFTWAVNPPPGLGLEPIATTGTFSVAPSSFTVFPHLPAVAVDVAPSTPGGPIDVVLTLTTPGLSNPGSTLPSLLDARAFLANTGIRYILLPLVPSPADTATLARYLSAQEGAALAYSNSEWEVLTV